MVSMSTYRQYQAASGLSFAMFLLCHFVSHYSMIRSFEHGNSMMQYVRRIYQNPIIEVFIFISLFVHMTCNTMLYMKRSALEKNKENGQHKKNDGDTTTTTSTNPGSLELTAHRYAGYILALFIFGHVFATRGAALIGLQDPSQYTYTMITMTTDLFGFGFTIYLFVFGMSAVWHTVYGIRSSIAILTGHSVTNTAFPIPLKVVAMVLHILTILSVLSISGYIYHIDRNDPNQIEIFRSVKKAIGM
jgi:succinate dehydrogenase/fumarate reductase cytochrome b subunit